MLLSKSVLALAKLAPRERSRYTLRAIRVEPGCAVVTNGHYLVTVTHPESCKDDSAFPQTPGLVHKTLKGGSKPESVLIEREAAIGALKALPTKTNIPVLGMAALGEDDTLYVNTLDSVGTFRGKIEGTFPLWRDLVPTSEPVAEFCVDPKYIKLLAEYFIAHGKPGRRVRITVTQKKGLADGKIYYEPIRFDARGADQEDITALLMPCTQNDEEYPMRPDQVRAKESAEAAKRNAKVRAEARAEEAADAAADGAEHAQA